MCIIIGETVQNAVKTTGITRKNKLKTGFSLKRRMRKSLGTPKIKDCFKASVLEWY